MNNNAEYLTTPLDKALSAFGGNQKELAEKIGVSPQAITAIKKRGGDLPIRKMSQYVDVTGLSREELYPDYFK